MEADVGMAMWSSERIFVAVLSAHPTDAEWDRWIEMYLPRKGRDMRVVVESHHSGPDAKQRKKLSDALKGDDCRVAVMTESTFVRGIITALAWLGIPQRGFPVGAHLQAANYLELDERELEQVMRELPRLRREAGVEGLQSASG
jgi:hypothetical protein